MDLIVHTLKGSFKIEGVSPTLQIQELISLLESSAPAVFSAARQRLIHKGSVLEEGTLQDAGLSTGDALVALLSPELPPEPPIDLTPLPTRESIAAAIKQEAARRGIEVKDDTPSAARRPGRNAGLHAALSDLLDGDSRLMALIESLGEGQFLSSRVEAPMMGPFSPLPSFGPPQPAATSQPEPLTVPDPNPGHMAQLTDMGFPEPVARKALLLHRNDLQGTLDWLLLHGEDEDAATPLTEEQLRRLYGQPSRAAQQAAQVEQLVEMGFSAEQARAALSRFRNVDMALAYLLRQGQQTDASQPAAAAAAAPSSTAHANPIANTAARSHPASSATNSNPSPAPSSDVRSQVAALIAAAIAPAAGAATAAGTRGTAASHAIDIRGAGGHDRSGSAGDEEPPQLTDGDEDDDDESYDEDGNYDDEDDDEDYGDDDENYDDDYEDDGDNDAPHSQPHRSLESIDADIERQLFNQLTQMVAGTARNQQRPVSAATSLLLEEVIAMYSPEATQPPPMPLRDLMAQLAQAPNMGVALNRLLMGARDRPVASLERERQRDRQL